MKILFLLGILFWGSTSAQAAVEVKGSGGQAEKALAQVWGQGLNGVSVKFDGKNSSDAVDQFLGRGSDFLLTETALRKGQVKRQGSRSLVFLPVALTAQVVVYNLPGVAPGELKLSVPVISDIFLGVIKNWNDPAIRKLNPRLLLPDLDIFVIHLSNTNSLNDPFPALLATENAQWTLKREKDKNLHWPVGQNVGDDAKAFDKVRQWAGSIVVLDYAYAAKHQLPMAQVRNRAGKFVKPNADSLEAALSGTISEEPSKFVSSKGLKAYPLTLVRWAAVDANYGSDYHQPKKAEALKTFLNSILSEEGQTKAADLTGAPLPKAWVDSAVEKIGSIQF